MKGDLVEAAFERWKIVLTPTTVIDRSKFPNADNEYTPAQRRVIDARLKKSLEEVKRGHTVGPQNLRNPSLRAKKYDETQISGGLASPEIGASISLEMIRTLSLTLSLIQNEQALPWLNVT